MSDSTISTHARAEAVCCESRFRDSSADINLKMNPHKQALRQSLYDVLADAVRNPQKQSSKTHFQRILDVGCGRGELLHILSSQGHHVTGMDPDPACAAASARFSSCVQCTIAEAPSLLASVSFDTIVVSHVLEHLSNPYDALTDLRRLNAARYVLAVPNVHRPVRLVRTLAGSSRCDHPRHIHGWGRPEFQALLASAGFTHFRWYTDRVTVNPFSGGLGAIVGRLVSPIELRILPRFFPALSSSLIVSCCSKVKRQSDGGMQTRTLEKERPPQP